MLLLYISTIIIYDTSILYIFHKSIKELKDEGYEQSKGLDIASNVLGSVLSKFFLSFALPLNVIFSACALTDLREAVNENKKLLTDSGKWVKKANTPKIDENEIKSRRDLDDEPKAYSELSIQERIQVLEREKEYLLSQLKKEEEKTRSRKKDN